MMRGAVMTAVLALLWDDCAALSRPAASGGSAATTPTTALSDAEIIEIFDKVPVFALADGEGNAAVVSDGTSDPILEFFLEPAAAQARMRQLDGDGASGLKITGQSLGRALMAYRGADAPIKAAFHGDPRELTAARQLFLSGADPAGETTHQRSPKEVLEAYVAADASGKFATPLTIPLFSIPQMVLEKRGEGGPVRAWFFSMADLLDQWKRATDAETESSAAYDNGEVQMQTLDEVLAAMRGTGDDLQETDFRAALFVPTKSALAAIGVRA